MYRGSVTISNLGCSVSKTGMLQANPVFSFFNANTILFASTKNVCTIDVIEFIDVSEEISEAGPS